MVAGVVGAGIWAGVSYALEVEIGWIAWGIGLLVGAAIAGGSGGEGGLPAVIAAVVITVASICAGKYAAIHFAVERVMSEANPDGMKAPFNDEWIILSMIDETAIDREASGEQLNWPVGMSYEDAYERQDYPADIVADIDSYWDGLSESDRESVRGEYRLYYDSIDADMDSIVSSIKSEGFKESFGVMDILFFVLTIGTAGRLAGGNLNSES